MKKASLFIILSALIFGCQSPNPTTEDKSTESTSIAEMDDASIGKMLDSILVEDQQYRGQIDSVDKEFGWESTEMQQLMGKMHTADLSNQKIVTEILDTHGWLGAEEVGSDANRTLFLVIQHADQETQEKYLPMMRQAVKDGKASASRLALLEDRIALGNGEPQIYGSQIGTNKESGEYYVLPMTDPDKVNERRASVGLGSIEEYVKYFNMEWDLEAYKKQLPELMKELEQRNN